MKINFYGFQTAFKGRREDRNTASQLRNNNNYALNEPNQRKINQAIENLSNYSGEENVEFLLDLADNLKYGTNIDNGKPVNFVYKGSNIFTEHYSAIRAEVPDPEDRQTVTNMGVIKILKNSDRIIVCGEALSHCVKYTVNDIIEYIPEEKLYILDDCSSPVTGFEEQGKAFLREMEERGANIVSSDFVIENF